jgi:uncharacterized protein (TIGR00255 family)
MSSTTGLKSMTAFAHAAGYTAPFHWAWEIKSVNAKGLDLRVRLAHGFDALESEARAAVARVLTRGTVYLTLTVTRDAQQAEISINHAALMQLVQAVESIPHEHIGPASLDGLLAVKGIVDVRDHIESDEVMAKAQSAVRAGLDDALLSCVAMRQREGQALAAVLMQRIDRIAHLVDAAEHHPARAVDTIKARLAQSIEALMSANAALDPARLHQEALLLAAKADVREELDRLKTHIQAVRELCLTNGAVGRKLDFLAQELGREANTFCAKSNDAALTALGMDMRLEIEQFREQVQNIE